MTKNPYHATFHYDPHGKEWVIRLHSKGGFCGLGGAVAKEEASLIVDSLNALLEHAHGATSEEHQRAIASNLLSAANSLATFCGRMNG